LYTIQIVIEFNQLRYTSILKKFYVLFVKALIYIAKLLLYLENLNENYLLGINLRCPVKYTTVCHAYINYINYIDEAFYKLDY
jgi:hypothetical protein